MGVRHEVKMEEAKLRNPRQEKTDGPSSTEVSSKVDPPLKLDSSFTKPYLRFVNRPVLFLSDLEKYKEQ